MAEYVRHLVLYNTKEKKKLDVFKFQKYVMHYVVISQTMGEERVSLVVFKGYKVRMWK